MAESKKAAADEVAALKAENEALKAEIAALKAVNAAEEVIAPTVKRLSADERVFEVSWEEVNPKDETKPIKKSGKGRLLDVAALTISGRKYSQEEFMSDKEAQLIAFKMDHLLIEKLK